MPESIVIPVEDVCIDIDQLANIIVNNLRERDILKFINNIISNEDVSYTALIDLLEQTCQTFREGVSYNVDDEDLDCIDRYSSILLNKMETTIEEYGFR